MCKKAILISNSELFADWVAAKVYVNLKIAEFAWVPLFNDSQVKLRWHTYHQKPL